MTDFYHLEPHDPIVLGDGRSIGNNTATASVDLPFPSTLAGLVRTTLGRKADGSFDAGRIPQLKAQALTGPLLVRLDPEPVLLVPAPADALFLAGKDDPKLTFRRCLRPQALRPDEATDLGAVGGLRPVGLGVETLDKPTGGPRYWFWPAFEKWLVKPDDQHDGGKVDVAALGLARLEHEERIHVALNPQTRTVIDGAMFRTDGVRYVHGTHGAGGGRARFERYGIRFGWDGGFGGDGGKTAKPSGLGQRTVSLGGERRLSGLEGCAEALPGVPNTLLEGLKKSRVARIVLLTPALFDAGFRPAAFDQATLLACAVARFVVVSGWDHERTDARKFGGPKRSRRCAPAGSVYWVKLDEGVDVDAWVKRHWFKNISSAAQDRLDGFGLAVVGVGEVDE